VDPLYKHAIMRNDTVLNRLLAEGVEPIASAPDQFRAQIARENRKWAHVIRSADVKVN
jgi:tripartite-type tricarboxylate transporter receptor subunit TctC